MFYRAFLASLAAVSAFTPAHAHAGHHHKKSNSPLRLVSRQAEDLPFSAAKFPDVQKVLEGNQRFQDTRDKTLFDSLVNEGQEPPFAIFACSDSRAPPETIFDAEPGTFFTERNIANQYKPGDENAQSVMAYGIRVLGVQHIVILGHYGCGGVAASIASAPKTGIDVATHIVQTWIGDIRQLYLSSNRSEIATMREANLAIEAEGGVVGEPEIQDPGFRALVEENVKQQVKRLSESSVIANLHEEIAAAGLEGARRKRAEEEVPLIPIFVHGWVHDLETGEVIDLGVSTGPPGFENFVPGEEENVEEPPAEETSSVEEPPAEETSSVEEPPAEETSTVEEPPAEETSSAEESSSEEATPTESADEPAATDDSEVGSAQPDVIEHPIQQITARNIPGRLMRRSALWRY